MPARALADEVEEIRLDARESMVCCCWLFDENDAEKDVFVDVEDDDDGEGGGLRERREVELR